MISAGDFLKAVSHQELGAIYLYTGKWQEADNELKIAAEIFKKSHNVQSLCIVESYDSIRQLMMSRDIQNPLFINAYDVIEKSINVLFLAEKVSQGSYSQVADYVRAYYLIGTAHRKTGDLTMADEYLAKAISMCRQINIIDQESSILLELAKLRYFQGNKVESLHFAKEALLITEHYWYVLQGADVNLWLASLALEGFVFEDYKLGNLGDMDVAVRYAKEALKLATCDGGEYKYKVAYDEASRMLESLK